MEPAGLLLGVLLWLFCLYCWYDWLVDWLVGWVLRQNLPMWLQLLT